MTDSTQNSAETATARCEVCGEPMPPNEQMFKFHGLSGPCPAPPMDRVTTRRDGTARNPAVAGVLKHFRYAHLPEHLQAVSRPCGELAFAMADALPDGPDLTCGLRDLLTAKDNFVRAKLG